MLWEYNDTTADYPADKTIRQLFEAQAAANPGNIAAIGPVQGQQPLTYRQLNEKSNSLAHGLIEQGTGPGSLVAVMAERSLEMIIAIFAVLKAGGAYLPIDPHGPEKRMHLMLADSRANLLLTQEKFLDKAAGVGGAAGQVTVINLEEPDLYGHNLSNLEHVNSPADPAYVIYTSGSTGLPKGVIIEHHSLVNRLNWMQKKYPLTVRDRILQKTPVVFDVSVWELFWWSMTGASVCFIAPGFEKFPQAIIETVEKHRITTMHFVPSMMAVFLDYIRNSPGEVQRLSSLRQVFVSGEALKPAHVKMFNSSLNYHNATRLINLYGPTETTVDVTYFDCSPYNQDEHEIVPIGKPIDNTQIVIIDEQGEPCPPGEPGELCIAGAGLAKGYLNRPELTAETFVLKRFNHEEHEEHEGPGKKGPGNSPSPVTRHPSRFYKTGDLARLLPDGNIEFLGRMDLQVKIRGLRIELGEIEAVLTGHRYIRDCAALVKQTSDTIVTIIAYLVADKPPEAKELKQYLKQYLPEYMIPADYIYLDRLPLTPNGKVDREALRSAGT
jgi:amino acid adenylation domain-containing protein